MERMGAGPHKSEWTSARGWETLEVDEEKDSFWLLANWHAQKICFVFVLQGILQEARICFKIGGVGCPSLLCHSKNSFFG